MKIIQAAHLGMCFGVRDAIDLALQGAKSGPLTILGELVHNQTVLQDLKRQGVRIELNAAEVSTETVMITAHGASEKTLNRVRERGLNLIEATCPLVHFAHRAVRQLIEQGYHPVIIGKRDHVEVRGLTEDLADFAVILSEEDIERLPERARFGVAAQTTQPIDRVRRLVQLLKERFPRADVRFADTVCHPTKQRQSAAVELARQCEVVIVVGGANSNNTRELVETCRREGAKAYHVQTAADLKPEWIEGRQTVGVTAGTSTPDSLIAGVMARLEVFARESQFANTLVS